MLIIFASYFINFRTNIELKKTEGIMGWLLHKSQNFYNYVFLFVGSTILGTLIVFGLVGSLNGVFQPVILIYRRAYFVNHYWGRTSIYRPLFYPFGSLPVMPSIVEYL